MIPSLDLRFNFTAVLIPFRSDEVVSSDAVKSVVRVMRMIFGQSVKDIDVILKTFAISDFVIEQRTEGYLVGFSGHSGNNEIPVVDERL